MGEITWLLFLVCNQPTGKHINKRICTVSEISRQRELVAFFLSVITIAVESTFVQQLIIILSVEESLWNETSHNIDNGHMEREREREGIRD